jgi:hypothetical protein
MFEHRLDPFLFGEYSGETSARALEGENSVCFYCMAQQGHIVEDFHQNIDRVSDICNVYRQVRH